MAPKKKTTTRKADQPAANDAKEDGEAQASKQEETLAEAVKANGKAENDGPNEQPEEAAKATTKKESASAEDTKSSKKRKQASEKEQGTSQPSKSARRSGRSKHQPSQVQLLNFLLSAQAQDLCRPADETKDIEERGKGIRTYSGSIFTPFEELVCAMILSRPISHRLGLRTIRTIFNDPYSFTTARSVKDAGDGKRHQALWDAKTQHKQKTADQLGALGDLVLDKYTAKNDPDGTHLRKVLEESGHDVDQALGLLKDGVKGLGNTGLDIFLRRVQWVEDWQGGYPFIDGKTRIALKNIGLPQDAEALKEVVEQKWAELDTKGLDGDDEATKKRRAFVVVLERVVGADLEGKVEQLVETAMAA